MVRVFWAEPLGDAVGVAMEIVNGRTLRDIVRHARPARRERGGVDWLDVCSALTAVTVSGLLHGDIKAGNVMRDDEGRMVLMDFGAGEDLTQEPFSRRDFAGTPLYLAPELFEGHPRSRRPDIYSIGVLLITSPPARIRWTRTTPSGSNGITRRAGRCGRSES